MLQANIIEKWIQPKHSWLLPLVLLLINLYAIYVHHLSPVNFLLLFWYEIILIAVFTIIKMIFSLDGHSFTHLLGMRIMFSAAVVMVSIAALLAAIFFSADGFKASDSSKFDASKYSYEKQMMLAAYVLSVAGGFFYSGKFKKIHAGEQFIPFSKMVLLVILVSVLSHYVLSNTDNDGRQITLALVLLKYVIDMLYYFVQHKRHKQKNEISTNEIR